MEFHGLGDVLVSGIACDRREAAKSHVRRNHAEVDAVDGTGLVAGLVMNISEGVLHGVVLGHDAELLAVKYQLAMPQGFGAIAPLTV